MSAAVRPISRSLGTRRSARASVAADPATVGTAQHAQRCHVLDTQASKGRIREHQQPKVTGLRPILHSLRPQLLMTGNAVIALTCGNVFTCTADAMAIRLSKPTPIVSVTGRRPWRA